MTVVQPTVRTPTTDLVPMRLHQFQFRQTSSTTSVDNRRLHPSAPAACRLVFFLAVFALAVPKLADAQESQSEPLTFGTSFQPDDPSNGQPGNLAPNQTPIEPSFAPDSNQQFDIPNDVIVDQTFAQNGPMFNQLVEPPTHTQNFPGWGTAYKIGHQTGRAIGRKESITNLGAMPYVTFDNTMFYAEAQAFRANGGDLKWGGMAGGGIRYYVPELDRTFGGGAFYSRDDISGVDFQQLIFSAETMGEFFDARANFHMPTGDRTGTANIDVIQSSARFVRNILEFDQFRDLVTSMQGVDYEFVIPLPGPMGDDLDLRLAVGGYYFDGPEVADVLGWKMRMEANVFDKIDLELQVSDDQTFNTSVMFGASFTFGGLPKDDRDGSQRDRMTEWGRRIPHAVVAQTRVRDVNLTAINPADGEAYRFLHVDSNFGNDTTGTGLVEPGTPFRTISRAQTARLTPANADTDFIIVHANSVYSAGDFAPGGAAVVLNAGDQIFGLASAVQHSIPVQGVSDELILPNVEEGSRPLFSIDGAAIDGVQLANDSIFSGFTLDNPGGNGIVAANLTSAATASFNEVHNAALAGILITSSPGTEPRIDLVNTSVEFRLEPMPFTTATTATEGLVVLGGAPRVKFISLPDDTGAAPGGKLDYQIDGHGHIVRVTGTTGGFVNMLGSTIRSQPTTYNVMLPFNPAIAAIGGQGILIGDNSATPIHTAGNVSIDNALIYDSVLEGINIRNTSGLVDSLATFRTTEIIGATNNSINIEEARGRVSFGSRTFGLTVRNSRAIGINVYELGVDSTGTSTASATGTATFNIPVNVDVSAAAGPPTSGTASAINIQHMTTGSRTTFSNNVTTSQSGGIGINIGGNDVLVPGGLAGNDAGSAVRFSGSVAVGDPGGSGIRVANDEADVVFNTVSVTNRSAIGIELVGQPDGLPLLQTTPYGDVAFQGNVTVDNGLGITGPAIEIRNSNAHYIFGIPGASGITSILNPIGTITPLVGGVNIINNTDDLRAVAVTPAAKHFKAVFNDLQIATATGGPGLHIDNDDLGDAILTTTDLPAGYTPVGDRATVFGAGIPPLNVNSVVRTHGGSITATGVPAVWADDSGIDITLATVNSDGGPYGVFLRDTHFVRIGDLNNPNYNFEISGDSAAAGFSGGTFEDQTIAGVFAKTDLVATPTTQNPRTTIYNNDRLNSRVKLKLIDFSDSQAAAVDGVYAESIQRLLVDSSSFGPWGPVGANAIRNASVETLNTIQVHITQTTFDDMDDGGPEDPTLLLTSTLIPPNSQSYRINIDNSDIIDQSSHAIAILTEGPLLADADGAPLILVVNNNDRILVSEEALTGDPGNVDGGADGLHVVWNGRLNATITNNGSTPPINLPFGQFGFVMGVNNDQNADNGQDAGGILINTVNDDAQADVTVRNNFFFAHSQGNVAADFIMDSPTDIIVSNNFIGFQPLPINAGTAVDEGNGSIGLRFAINNTSQDDVIISTNQFIENTRPYQARQSFAGPIGIQFESWLNADVQIDNNFMQRTTVEIGPFFSQGFTTGIDFGAPTGLINLFGNQDNVIISNNPFIGGLGGVVNGAILINGQPAP